MRQTTKEPLSENRASDVVEANLTEYLAEVLAMQFPSAIDGLKKVQMRFLWAGRKGEFDQEIKSQMVVGAVLKLHNYGDTSAYEALIRMAQSWNMFPPIVKVHGNYGSYSGNNPAHVRYTSMELTAFARDVFYGGIDLSVLPMTFTPDSEFEPLHFIPSVPTALLYDSLAIGFGYQSKTAAHNLANVCDLVAAYGMHQSKTPYKPFEYTKYAEKFLPDFPNPCVLTNSEELIAAYKQGDFEQKILLEGNVILAHDRIVVQSLPNAAWFAKAKTIVEDALLDSIKKKQGKWDSWIASITHPSKVVDFGNLNIELRRGANVFDVWDELKKLLKFSGTFKPIPNYSTSDGRIIRLSPLSLLYVWFEKRRHAIMSSKRKRLERMQRELRIVEAQLIVYDYVDDVITLIRTAQTRAEAIQKLQTRFDLSDFQATSLTRLEIGNLTQTSRVEFEARRAKQVDEIRSLTESFGKIGEEIAAEALRIKKTYHTPRRTLIPKYIGVVYIAGGAIQIETTAEIDLIAGRFPRGELKVVMYDGPNFLHIQPDGRPSRGVASKYTRGELHGLSFPGESGYTVSISDGAICAVAGVVPGRRSEGYYYTTKLAKVLTRKGEVRTIDVTKDIPLRKSLGRGNNTDIIYLYPNTANTHYLTILNDKEPNIVHLQRVDGGAGRIVISPHGNLIISHSFTGKDWYLSIPEGYLNRVSARIFHVVDAEALLGNNKQIRLNLGTNEAKRNRHFTMIA